MSARPVQNRRRITWEAPVPHPACHQISFGSLDGSRSRRLLAQSLVQSLSVQHHAIVEICRYQVVLAGKHRRVTLTGNVCLTSSCHGGCVYQRVFDGEVETFFCVSFQMFNKLEIFLVLRLHVGQHLHTLTVKTTDSEAQSSPVRLNYFRKTSRVTSHPEGHFGCVVVLVSSVPGPEMGSN